MANVRYTIEGFLSPDFLSDEQLDPTTKSGVTPDGEHAIVNAFGGWIQYFRIEKVVTPTECHCGDQILTYEDGFTRLLCRHCSTARCDLDPGACGL